MESIDITDSTFTLNIPENMDMDMGSKLNMDTLQNSFSNTFLDNYMMIIFIGLFCIGIFIYKYYHKKNPNTENMDCPGGFCNMRKNDTNLQEH